MGKENNNRSIFVSKEAHEKLTREKGRRMAKGSTVTIKDLIDEIVLNKKDKDES